MLYYVRLVLGSAMALLAAGIIQTNISSLVLWKVRGKLESPLPFGGVLGGAAMLLLPYPTVNVFAWVPMLIDPASLPLALLCLYGWLSGRMLNTRHSSRGD